MRLRIEWACQMVLLKDMNCRLCPEGNKKKGAVMSIKNN
jgi:hypothetical protein